MAKAGVAGSVFFFLVFFFVESGGWLLARVTSLFSLFTCGRKLSCYFKFFAIRTRHGMVAYYAAPRKKRLEWYCLRGTELLVRLVETR